MRTNTILYLLGLIVVSTLGALVVMYPYGSWQHDRYWAGTIQRVKAAEMELVSGLLNRPSLQDEVGDDPRAILDLLTPLRPFFLMEISRNGQLVESSGWADYELSERAETIVFSSGLELKISGYAPPDWSREYWKWLGQPGRWFTSRFDTKTVPFLCFFGLIFFFLVALSSMHRTRHLESDVLPLLRRLQPPEDRG